MKTPRKTGTILMAFLLMLPATIRAGAGADANAAPQQQEISLREALAVAFANSPEYRISVYQVNQAKDRVLAAWGQLMPAIESEASVYSQGADSGPMSLTDGQYDIKVAQIKFGVNPGAVYNTLKLSYTGQEIALTEQKKIRAQIEFNVIKAYFDVIVANEIVGLRKSTMQVFQQNLKDVRGLYETGSVPKFELLQAQIKLKSQEPLVKESENNYRTAIGMFNFHLGLDGLPMTVKNASLRDGVSRPAPIEDTISELLARAMVNRPEILQISLQKEASTRASKAEQSAYIWPYFTFGAYYGFTYYLPNQVDLGSALPVTPDFSQMTGRKEWQETWQVRVAATYRWSSLLPIDSHNAASRAELEKAKEAEERLSQMSRLTTITIRSIYERLLTAYDTILLQEKNIETAEEGLRIARESYKAGVIKNSDLLNAELNLTDARTAYIKAVYLYHVGRAELDRETGMNNDDIIFREK